MLIWCWSISARRVRNFDNFNKQDSGLLRRSGADADVKVVQFGVQDTRRGQDASMIRKGSI
jgi:hypothetical protein